MLLRAGALLSSPAEPNPESMRIGAYLSESHKDERVMSK